MARIRPDSPRSVAIVSATAPYPPDSGKKVVVAGLVDYWRARVGAENVHYVLVAPAGVKHDDFPVPVVPVRRPSMAEQLAGVAVRTVATRRHTLQESMLYARRIRRDVGRILAEVDADVEIFDTVRLAQYAEELAVRRDERRVVYLDDLFSLRYERMRAALRGHPDIKIDPLGEFRTHIPRPLRPVAHVAALQQVLLQAEQRLVARRELASARAFAACLLVNPDEAADLAARANRETVHALPPLVPNRPRAHRDIGGSPEFVFLGLLTLPHNHDAMAAFLRHQMPALIDRVPDVVMHIVGRGARPALLSLASEFDDHVQVHGFVPDLDGLLARSCALVSPLRFGSGIKLKLLEALARGVPVVSTSIGAEGVAAGPQHGVLIEDDLDQHPRLMDRLTDRDFNQRMSRAARAHFDTTFSTEAVFRRYDEIFGF